MKTVFVTGATGLIGSAICTRLLERGDKVRTIVRSPDASDAEALRKAGVDVIPGDVGDLESVREGAKGANGIIHSAAILGRPGITIENSMPTNVLGTIHTLTAAAELGVPTVQLLTTTFFDMLERTFDEFSPYDLLYRNRDIYTITKRLAYAEGFTRVASGQDIRFMIPGAAYGPSICVERAMVRPSFNDRICSAIRNDMQPTVPLPIPFVMTDDCAFVCVAALDKGAKGERYVAHGREQDIGTLASILNVACEMAGVKHRVEEIPKERLDDPEVIAKVGPSMPELAKRHYPTPFSDSSFTQKRLGYVPTPLDKGFTITIEWMRKHGYL